MIAKIRVYGRFIRLWNCLVAAGTSLAGSWTANHEFDRDKPWLLALSVFLIAAFGNAYNDICDYPTDVVNRPKRPLVTGQITKLEGLRIAGWCLLLGLMIAAYAYIQALMIATAVSAALFLYDRNLKSQPLLGNLTIAGICAVTVAYGAVHRQWNRQVVVLTVCAASLTLARELYKDIQDIPGDRAMGARTLPILWGPLRSALVAFVPLCFTIGFVLYRMLSSTPNLALAYIFGIILIMGMCWTAVMSLRTAGADGWGRRSLEVKIWVTLGILWVLAWRYPPEWM